MEIQLSLSFSLITCLFLVFALFKSGRAKKIPNQILKLPPGPWKLPIIGSMHHLISRRLLHHTIADLAKKHGPLMHLKFGQVSAIVISSPEMVKEAFRSHDQNFSDRPSILHMKIFSYDFSDVGLCPYGSVWRLGRKICLQELLSANRVKSFGFLMEDEISNLVSSISSSIGAPINFTNKMFLLSSSIISRAAFGKVYKNHERFLLKVKQAMELLATPSIADFFPALKLLQIFSGSTYKLRAAHKELDKIIGDIIEDHIKRRATRNNNKDENEEEYLVDVLLRHHECADLEIDNIKAIILDMFAAGSETTALNLISVMSELVRHPRVMAKAQAEVRKALSGGNIKFDRTFFEKLSYLKCIIKESFRFHPTGPFLIPRQSRETCKIDGYTIPAKTQVMVHAWAVGRDPKYWKDGESFYPERFDGSSLDFKGTHFEFTPFGMGRRICPGTSFALSVMEHTLVQHLYHFNWELLSGLKPEDLDMTDTMVGIALHRKHDLLLSATPYAP